MTLRVEQGRRAHARRANLVFGRGGVRGIAMVGAVAALERAGWTFERFAGISVGAIVAALMAAGYRASELRAAVWELDLASLCDTGSRLPRLGAAWRLCTRLGLYEGTALLGAMRELLARKGVRTFADLRDPHWDGRGSPYRLQVLVSDLTRTRLAVLPDDARDYGIEPDAVEVAAALRMSASLPLLFQPVRFGIGAAASVMVDGGLVAGIPFPVFDCAQRHGLPTFGVQAGPGPRRYAGRPVRGLWSLMRATYYTALLANDHGTRPRAQASAMIDIDCGETSAVAFSLSDPQKQALFDAGFAAADAFVRVSWSEHRDIFALPN